MKCKVYEKVQFVNKHVFKEIISWIWSFRMVFLNNDVMTSNFEGRFTHQVLWNRKKNNFRFKKSFDFLCIFTKDQKRRSLSGFVRWLLDCWLLDIIADVEMKKKKAFKEPHLSKTNDQRYLFNQFRTLFLQMTSERASIVDVRVTQLMTLKNYFGMKESLKSQSFFRIIEINFIWMVLALICC